MGAVGATVVAMGGEVEHDVNEAGGGEEEDEDGEEEDDDEMKRPRTRWRQRLQRRRLDRLHV